MSGRPFPPARSASGTVKHRAEPSVFRELNPVQDSQLFLKGIKQRGLPLCRLDRNPVVRRHPVYRKRPAVRQCRCQDFFPVRCAAKRQCAVLSTPKDIPAVRRQRRWGQVPAEVRQGIQPLSCHRAVHLETVVRLTAGDQRSVIAQTRLPVQHAVILQSAELCVHFRVQGRLQRS